MTVALLAGAFTIPLAAQRHPSFDVVQIVMRSGKSPTLVAALKAAGLVDALRSAKSVTILAPNEKAFARLPKGTLARLLQPENRAALQRILKYHVVVGAQRYGSVRQGGALKTLAGPSLTVSRDTDGRVLLDGTAGFGGINSIASNGFVHEIDRVLMPPSDDLVATAAKAGRFKTLIAAAEAAGLAGALTGEKNLTVLAPTDAAFAKLGKKTIQSLLRPENKAKLAAILQYHVLPGRVSAIEALELRSAESLLRRGRLNFGLVGGRLSVQDANVVVHDIQASNGVIHVIDRVLTPPASLVPKAKPRGH